MVLHHVKKTVFSGFFESWLQIVIKCYRKLPIDIVLFFKKGARLFNSEVDDKIQRY